MQLEHANTKVHVQARVHEERKSLISLLGAVITRVHSARVSTVAWARLIMIRGIMFVTVAPTLPSVLIKVQLTYSGCADVHLSPPPWELLPRVDRSELGTPSALLDLARKSQELPFTR